MSTGILIFLYCIVAYGACNVIAFGSGPFKIFENLRYWTTELNEHFGTMFSCMMCLPTNFGLLCSVFNWFLIPIAFTPFNIAFAGTGLWWLAMLCDAAFTSGIVWLIHTVQEYIENKSTTLGEKIYED
jgi:hypothetical protein